MSSRDRAGVGVELSLELDGGKWYASKLSRLSPLAELEAVETAAVAETVGFYAGDDATLQ